MLYYRPWIRWSKRSEGERIKDVGLRPGGLRKPEFLIQNPRKNYTFYRIVIDEFIM